jgi:hypothetical protein
MKSTTAVIRDEAAENLATISCDRAASATAWAVRRDRIDRLLGGGLNDQLPARGALGLAAKKAIAEGRLALLAPFAAEQIKTDGAGLRVSGQLGGQPHDLTADRIVVATGFRPDLSPFSELRLSVDPIMEAPPALAPLIDPKLTVS